ncbi:probable F-box protein At1g65740 [Solanum dulcamara]|uniref:probable F-box protein At1g65740 n=1 Tax=Solanum dulcamara TaxID=45834 RepID=UPI00248617CD|nr:probable F-box protein At1g65740 [Solanum dulcamara]
MRKRNWSEVEYDVLVEIAKRVREIDDFIRFGAVCKSWYRAAKKENFDSSSPQVPLLLMAADKDDDYRLFYSVTNHRIFAKIYLPQARGCVCLSTEQPGWLFTVQFTITTGDMMLLHPFSGTQIHLPSYRRLRGIEDGDDQWKPEYFSIIKRAVLSANPSLTSDYFLMISHYAPRRLMSFWRPGDLCWTSVHIENPFAFVDFRYFNGKFYILSRCCGLWVVDDLEEGHRNNPPPSVRSRLVLRINREILRWDYLHLVQVSGVLLFVAQDEERARSTGFYKDYRFQVWELDVMTSEAKEIKMLGDRAIFLGQDASMSVESSKYIGVNPNHIYFINSVAVIFRLQGWSGIDMRTYSLEDGKVQSSYHSASVNPISPPTWVIPSF